MSKGAAGVLTVGIGLLVATGCGDLTSGGMGEVEVIVAATGSQEVGELEGTVHATMEVYARTATGRLVEITDGPQELQLDLASRETASIALGELRATRYGGLRARFHRLEVQVQHGLVVDGDSIRERVRVDLGSPERIEVDVGFAFDVPRRGRATLVLELNADGWLPRLDAETCRASDCRVAPEAFADEFRVRREDR